MSTSATHMLDYNQSQMSGLMTLVIYSYIHLFITSFQSNALSDTVVGCPEACFCVSSGPPEGGTVVNCSSRGFKSVPTSVPEGTVEIDMSANLDMTKLTFHEVKPPLLRKLRRLIVRTCHLRQISADVFSGELLPSLDILDLSHNDIEKMPIASDHTYAETSLSMLFLRRNKIRFISDVHLNLYPRIRRLNLDNNLIVSINNASFRSLFHNATRRVSTLETLSIRRNRIANIESGAFREMALLKRLDLSRNRLSSVGARTFAGLANLRHLDLSGNQLGLVEDDSFRTLSTLHHLDVSRNRLPWIPRGLPMLDWFDISHNAVRNVSDDQQADLYPLEVVNLAHNPLHCDCHMLWLKELFDSREYLLRLKVIDLARADFVPTCSTPDSLASQPWDSLEDDVFVCRNDGGDGGSGTSGATSPADVLRVSLGAVRDTTVEIAWTVVSREIPFSTVIVQHYVFGQRAATVRHVQISATLRQYTLRRLRPATSYMVCVVPHLGGAVDGKSVTPFSFDHCVEVATKEASVPREQPSHTSLFSCYVCSMLITVACVLGCIGGAAMIFGVVCGDDSEKAEVDEYAYDSAHVGKQHAE
ncbi:hypothetical protein NP493_1101g00050 [Ridgeia piscesae]|uniref:Fibronectin type-III domain-containing protein n=1 Tax=Ridgeia piscesae TaxID=27915 RepID=A0AAD9NI32_RIDPI|nr:hypothetical protein NP493_1101g00050 [Ridgeia piscesae]